MVLCLGLWWVISQCWVDASVTNPGETGKAASVSLLVHLCVVRGRKLPVLGLWGILSISDQCSAIWAPGLPSAVTCRDKPISHGCAVHPCPEPSLGCS